MSTGVTDPEDQISILSVQSLDPSPDTITSTFLYTYGVSPFQQHSCSGLVRRVKTLTLRLLPVEVPPDTISDPTSRIITPAVINAYIDAAGDFTEAVSKT